MLDEEILDFMDEGPKLGWALLAAALLTGGAIALAVATARKKSQSIEGLLDACEASVVRLEQRVHTARRALAG